jgi:hypothetical protein
MQRVMAYCRIRHCSPNQFLHAAIQTELQMLNGNAPYSEIKGDNNRVSQGNVTHNTFNLFSGNAISLLNDVRFYLWPQGGTLSDWGRAILFWIIGVLSTVGVAALNS